MEPDPFASGGVPDAATPVAGADPFAPDPNAPGPFRQGFGAGVEGVKSSAAGFGALAAHAVGATDTERAALAAAAAHKEAAAALSPAANVDWKDPSSVINYFKWTIGNAAPMLAVMAAGGVLGRGAGAVLGRLAPSIAKTAAKVGGTAGAVLPFGATTAGEVYPANVESGVDNPALRAVAAGGAAGATALVPVLGMEKYLGAAGTGGFGAVAKSAVRGAAVGATVLPAQMVTQTAITRAAEGKSLTDPEAISDYIQSITSSLAPGALLGLGAGALHGRAAPALPEPRVEPPAPEAPLPAVTGVDETSARTLPDVEGLNAPIEVQPPLSTGVEVPTEPVQPYNRLEGDVQTGAQDADLQARENLKAQHAEATDKLAALDAELAAPKEGRTKEAVQLERAGQAEKLAGITEQLKQVEGSIKARDALAATPAEPLAERTPQAGHVIIGGEEVPDTKAAETAVAAVKRNLGMLVSSREAKLVPKRDAAAPELAATPEDRARSRTATVDEQTRQGAVETAAVQAAQPNIRELVAAKQLTPEGEAKVTTVLTNALNGIAKEAAAKPTTEAAQAHIMREVPKVLAGRVKSVDAEQVAKTMSDAVGQAHTLYSKGAVDSFERAEYEHSRLAGVESDPMAMRDISSLVNSAELELERPEEPGTKSLTKAQRAKIEAFIAKWKPLSVESRGAITQAEFDRMPEPARNAAVDAYNEVMAQRGQELTAHLRGLIGDDPNLTVNTFQAEPGSPIGSYTRVDPLKSVISLALNAKQEMSVADHEGYHYAEDHLLTGPERQIVANALKEGRPLYKALMEKARAYDVANKTQLADEIASVPEEARAYAFEFWRRGELQAEGPLARAWEKLRQFFDRVSNYVKGQGFKSIEDVFSALDHGQFAERARDTSDKPAGYWQGPGGLNDFYPTSEVPSVAERAKELLRNDRRWSPASLPSKAARAEQTDTPQFKKWFGDSKVVDAEGKPLVVYHGTASDITEPSGYPFWVTDEAPVAGSYADRAAFSETNDGEDSIDLDEYHPQTHGVVTAGQNVLPLYVRAANPLDLQGLGDSSSVRRVFKELQRKGVIGAEENAQDALDFIDHPDATSVYKILEELDAYNDIKSKGYDSVIITDVDTEGVPHKSIGVWDSTQIKSAIGNRGTFDATNPDIRFSKAAADMDRRFEAGELEHIQMQRAAAKIIDNARLSDISGQQAFGALWTEIKGGLSRFYDETLARPEYVNHKSRGYANTQKVLAARGRYKANQITRYTKEALASWHDGTMTRDDEAAVAKSMLDITSKDYKPGSREYVDATKDLTEQQKKMFDQATAMIGNMLEKELEVDSATWRANLPSDEAATLIANRRAQIDGMKGRYTPERRYGEHTVVVYYDGADKNGRPERMVLSREHFDRAGAAAIHGAQYQTGIDTANKVASEYQDLIKRTGAPLKIEVGIRHKAERDTTISLQQFLDTARRNGVNLTQPERERIVRATTAADSMRRNRIMRRKNVPGYSEDITRVIHEFAVGMVSKMTYNKFAHLIDAAADGLPVDIRTDDNGEIEAAVDSARNLWEEDGPLSGHFRNVADKLIDSNVVPDETGSWAKNLKASGMTYFIGMSLSQMAQNSTQVPLVTTPWLAKFTPYANATSTSLAALKNTWMNIRALRDINTLKDPAVPIGFIDDVPGLRGALIQAERGPLMDTEMHQIVGIAQGDKFAKSRTVQKAMDVWMAPFRVSEQANRIATFIAAYKIASQDGITSSDGGGAPTKLSGRALYEFADGAVGATQNDYGPANRPPIARNSGPLGPIGPLLFMFKSFPLFALETAHLIYKENPKAAAYMLLGFAATSGVAGMPFVQPMEDLIDTISQRVFNSPFNSRRAMRNMIKDASEALTGADFSPIVLHGGINDLMGADVGSRLGFGNFIPGTRIGAADADYGRSLEQILGAPYGMVANLTRAVTGPLMKGDFEATLRQAAPVAVRNIIKGVEDMNRGYATDAKGQTLIPVTGIEAAWQMAGFTSNGLSKAYEMDTIDKQTKAFYAQARTDMTAQLVQALRSGDAEKVRETVETVQAWNRSYPDEPISFSPNTIRRDIMLAGVPLNARTLMMLPRQLRGSSTSLESFDGR